MHSLHSSEWKKYFNLLFVMKKLQFKIMYFNYLQTGASVISANELYTNIHICNESKYESSAVAEGI